MAGRELFRIVQFIHPGGEHRVPRDAPEEGWFPWNTGDHRRKFIEAPARHLGSVDDPGIDGLVRFWGEWEPPSRYRRLPAAARASRGPRLVHAALQPPAPPDPPVQNTDPLVLGDDFVYSNCQQHRKVRGEKRPTVLHSLAPGSLILFGSPKGKPAKFRLDTVMVVGSSQVFVPRDYEGPDLVKRVVAIPLSGQSGGTTRYTLYRGVTWREQPRGPFSFVPSVAVTDPSPWFARPWIHPAGALCGRITPTLMQGFMSTSATTEQVYAAWSELVRQITDDGLRLAVSLRLPSQTT